MSKQQLPLADYDELPEGTLRHRIRSLNEDEMRVLLEHERNHANRVPVLELLDERLEELQQGATPTGGAEETPFDVPGQKSKGSTVGPTGPRETGRPKEHGTKPRTGEGIEHK